MLSKETAPETWNLRIIEKQFEMMCIVYDETTEVLLITKFLALESGKGVLKASHKNITHIAIGNVILKATELHWKR